MKTRLLASMTLVTSLALLGICQAADDAWQHSISLGLNTSHGNSETGLLNAEAKTQGTVGANQIKASLTYAYGETEDQTTTDNGKAVVQYNRALTQRAYINLNADIMKDDIAMIDYRLLAGPGFGYYLIKSDAHTLGVELGASYLTEGRTPASSSPDDTMAMRVHQQYNGQISKSASLWQSVEYLHDSDNSDRYLVNGELGIKTTITKKLSLQLIIQDRFNSLPAIDTEKNDITTKALLALSLEK